jgi:hypothetical protein
MENKATDIYKQFIEYLKSIESPKNLDLNPNLEKHHIVPKHAGGALSSEVVICCSSNHMLAHFYRFLAYGERGDWVCYCMRKNQKISTRDRALLGVEKCKKLGINFWNSEWQRKQGKKGGKISGLKNTPKQFAARSQVGLKNQSVFLKKILSKEMIWLYKTNETSFFKTTKPQNSISNLVNILQSQTPDLNKKMDKSSFNKILYGTRKQIYGWSLWLIKI